MHIPDGFIDGKTAAATAAISVTGIGLALRRVKRELPPRKAPLLGLAAAFLFAAQMLNFPVAGGTSGHLIGATLVAVLVGPSAAIVVVTTVLLVQCFLFADGGVTALGANVFNMGIVATVTGYGAYRLLMRWLHGARGQVTAIAFAAWFSTVLASISCAGQLALSRTVAWSSAFVAMTSVHILIGVGEGLISALVLLSIQRTRPDLIAQNGAARRQGQWRAFIGYGLLVALGLAIFVSPFACSWPDGLEFVAGKLGFEHKEAQHILAAPASNYQVPGIHWAAGATALAGAAGALIVFVLALLLGRLLVPKSSETGPESTARS
jgi:cobalt/nickel transport system permease protein